ncbi:probable 39S ribosomal protein L49, mitochondrial [Varroa jacobsoni]|uniref:probable 39S ribosomal protein L49, mitochondrial n=1 Tax=Varroa jacobsoni TaxID=62625 RepID=UPI000BF7C546|nr:probable 39S ribosomal protein L49, mitochondrial [Varroa jacobsoni]
MRGFYDDLTCKQTWRHARTDIRSRTPAELLLIEVDYSRSIIYLLENLVCYIRITMLRRSSKLFVPCLQGTLVRLALPSVQPHRKYAVEVPDEHRHNFDPENPNLTKFEVVDDPEVWKYVERILPQRTIPPSPKEEGASGWKPARLTREEARNLPYFVARTKNHMLPVYLKEEVRGPRYITYVCKVHGDPWALRNELKLYLDELFPQQHIVTKVNELTQKVGFKGKFVNEITEFLLKKGF